MSKRLFEDYLGDGLYVYHDGYHVWLYTSDGVEETNSVALEPAVLDAFNRWVARLTEEPTDDE